MDMRSKRRADTVVVVGVTEKAFCESSTIAPLTLVDWAVAAVVNPTPPPTAVAPSDANLVTVTVPATCPAVADFAS